MRSLRVVSQAAGCLWAWTLLWIESQNFAEEKQELKNKSQIATLPTSCTQFSGLSCLTRSDTEIAVYRVTLLAMPQLECHGLSCTTAHPVGS